MHQKLNLQYDQAVIPLLINGFRKSDISFEHPKRLTDQGKVLVLESWGLAGSSEPDNKAADAFVLEARQYTAKSDWERYTTIKAFDWGGKVATAGVGEFADY